MIGQRTRILREARGWTQTELAKRAKISQSLVAKLETGVRRSVSLATLQRLAKALGVPVTALLE